ncbi:MAG: sensor domain-containing diguanylate cyclase, partial [Candidatus Omnitrophica bacterium]|nr:sensor domain-containing diguanylate cyclase [Candidatus Omnitrophota bacterium]
KTGDIFDEWVVRHLGCLLVEDSRKDFRFDLSKPLDQSRPVGSLISAPLVSNNMLRGILRLDNPEPGFYNLDDLRLLMTIADIGAVALENDELYRKTKELAIHDGLTRLYTKGYFLERLKEECKRSLRQKRVFSLLLIDLDFFKKYNDEFGHPAGDIILQKVSGIIADCAAEKNALVSRFGGEEFCVVFFGIDKEKALEEAEEMRRQIGDASFVLRNVPTRVTLSIGVASFPDDAENETELMMRADKALYEAKENGRNRVAAYKGKQ